MTHFRREDIVSVRGEVVNVKSGNGRGSPKLELDISNNIIVVPESAVTLEERRYFKSDPVEWRVEDGVNNGIVLFSHEGVTWVRDEEGNDLLIDSSELTLKVEEPNELKVVAAAEVE